MDFNPATTGYENTFDIGFQDSIVDYNDKSWNISTLSDDLSTPTKENELKNDSIIGKLIFNITYPKHNLSFLVNANMQR